MLIIENKRDSIAHNTQARVSIEKSSLSKTYLPARYYLSFSRRFDIGAIWLFRFVLTARARHGDVYWPVRWICGASWLEKAARPAGKSRRQVTREWTRWTNFQAILSRAHNRAIFRPRRPHACKNRGTISFARFKVPSIYHDSSLSPRRLISYFLFFFFNKLISN